MTMEVGRSALLALCFLVAACGERATSSTPPTVAVVSTPSGSARPAVAPTPAEPNGKPGVSTPLHAAAKSGDLTAVRALLANSETEVDARDERGLTPLEHACSVKIEVVQALLDAHANVNARSVNGTTPLYIAARFGNTEIARLLLARGANVNARGEGGTALHMAVYRSPLDLVELLLKSGADVRLTDATGATALHVAATFDAHEAARLLLAAHASVNAVDREKNTPLHATLSFADATTAGSTKVAELLIKAGADVYAKNADGKSPLDVAESKHASAMITLFRAR